MLNVTSFWVSFGDQKLNVPTLPINFASTCKSYLKISPSADKFAS